MLEVRCVGIGEGTTKGSAQQIFRIQGFSIFLHVSFSHGSLSIQGIPETKGDMILSVVNQES